MMEPIQAMLDAALSCDYGHRDGERAVDREDMCAIIRALDRAGWAVVPIEPTQDQVTKCELAHGLLEGLRYEEGYRTMIEAGMLKP